MASVRRGRATSLAVVLLLAAPAAAEAGHIFTPGGYEGAVRKGRALKFAADHGGVHVLRTRMKLTCRNGEKKKVRVAVPHVEQLDNATGYFEFERGAGSTDVTRVTGILAGADAAGTVYRRKGPCRSGKRRWAAFHRGAHDHPDGHDHGGSGGHGTDAAPGLHVGNRTPYPALEQARGAHRRRAEALRVATNAAAARFATVAQAEAAGYVADPSITPIYIPGLVHYRKHGPNFWGRVLAPSAPQALIFWCPSAGDCSLAAFMYRAPATPLPETYGGLLGWHRHGERGHWMTHLWMTGSLAPALAQCAPFDALNAHNPLIAYERYRADIPGLDEPCAAQPS